MQESALAGSDCCPQRKLTVCVTSKMVPPAKLVLLAGGPVVAVRPGFVVLFSLASLLSCMPDDRRNKP